MDKERSRDVRIGKLLGDDIIYDVHNRPFTVNKYITNPTPDTEHEVRKFVAQQGTYPMGDEFWGKIFANQDPILAALEYQLGDYAKTLDAILEEADGD